MRKALALAAVLLLAGLALWVFHGASARPPAVAAPAAQVAPPPKPLAALHDALRFVAARLPSGALAGKVVGPGSAGARVALHGAGVEKIVLAGADGSYRFEGLGPGAYGLDATADALASETLGPIPLGRDEELGGLVLQLVAAGGLEGQVLDARTRAPLSGAHLSAGGAAAVTDPSGAFALHGIPPGQATLTVSRAGYVTSTTQLRVPRGQIQRGARLVLRPAAHVSGTVEQSDGTPVAGAPVFAERYDFGPVAAATPLGTTDAKGRFEGDLAPGEVTLRATAPNGEARSSVLSLHAGNASEGLVLVVDIGGEIEGRVVEESGHPVASASVYAVETASQRVSNGVAVAGDGTFQIPGLPTGVYAVIARSGARRVQKAGVRLSAGDTRQVEIRFGTGAIAGRVLDAAGAPLVGASVDVAPEGGSAIAETGMESGPDGAFRFEGLAGARFTVRAVAPAGDAERHGVAAGATDVVLRIETQGQLQGLVQDDDGQPVTDFSVMAQPSAPGAGEGRLASGNFASADGRFSLACAPGAYRVKVAAAGYEAGDAEEVGVPPRGGTASVQITLHRHARTITGTVLEDATHHPVSGATVATAPDLLYAFGRADAFHAGSTATSDAAGAFNIDVPAGAVSLFATAPGHGWARPVAVPAGATDPVTLVLPAGRNAPQSFPGVGMQIGPGFSVARVFEGGPADRAGVRRGDAIVAVDGKPVAGRSLTDVVGWIRGEVGTAVALTLGRSGQVITLTATRAEVRF